MGTEAKRKKAFFSSGLGFGMVMPVTGYGDTDDNTINYYGFKTWYETPKIAAEVDWYLGSGEYDLDEWGLGISILYFLATTDISPYLSLGLARKSITVRIYEYDDEYDYHYYNSYHSTGVALEGGGGLVIFRTYDFRFVFDVRLSTFLDDIVDFGGPHTALKIGLNVLYKKDKGGGCSGGCAGL